MLRDLWNSWALGGAKAIDFALATTLGALLLSGLFAFSKLSGALDWSWLAVAAPVLIVVATLLVAWIAFVLAIYALTRP